MQEQELGEERGVAADGAELGQAGHGSTQEGCSTCEGVHRLAPGGEDATVAATWGVRECREGSPDSTREG